MTSRAALAILLAGLAALMVSPASVEPAPCPTPVDLFTFLGSPGGSPNAPCSIIVGDKTFTGHDNLHYNGVGSFNPPGATNISVTPAISPTGLFGLEFSGGMFVSGGNSSLDILFDYQLVSSGALISDIHLAFNGGFTGSGHAQVTETVFNLQGNIIGQAQATNPPPEP